MARIPDDYLRRLLDRTDIVEVIGRYLPLKRAGGNYVARCPFHNEKTPSFTVSPSKQFYHCFGCGAHGTAITFLMQHGGLAFADAVRELAAHAGLPPPEPEADAPARDAGRTRLIEIMAQAERFYRQQLKASARAVDYLKGRGLNGRTAARFGLGYAPDAWRGLAQVFEDYAAQALVEAGLVIVGEGGRRYDRFRDRIIFPIRNDRGEVVAFGGRILGAGEPKYLNSPDTPLFAKGRELYGLHEQRRAIQQAGTVLVVEGYMDVVMLAQHGVDHAVATLGTALTPEQARKLLRLAEEVVFAFDGDAAGRKAAWRALENVLPHLPDGRRVAFLFLPEGEDPDSYVRTHGAEAFRQHLRQALPLSDYFVEALSGRTELASQEGRVRLIKLAEPYLRQMVQAPLLAAALRRRLAELTGLPVAQPRPRPQGAAANQTARPPRVRPSPWRTALIALLHEPTLARGLSPPQPAATEEARQFLAVLELIRQHPHIEHTRDLLELLRERPQCAPLLRHAADLLALGADYDAAADLQDALYKIAQQARRREIELLSRKPLAELTPLEQQRLRESLHGGKLQTGEGVKSS
ncbi:MAG: DNA primase [Thiobacillaceae bacterium]|nr:DNA primase [Thiobacillaceae bacterium]MDW8324475.1 DNA primase [Burkholderiales bacterium]